MVTQERKKKFTIDVGIVFVSSIIVLFLHFIQKPIIARYIGADGLGLFSLTIKLMWIVEIIAGLGIYSAIVKYSSEYAHNNLKLNSLISTAFCIAIISGTIAGSLVYLSSPTIAIIFGNTELIDLARIYSLFFPFVFLNSIIVGVFNGLRQMKYFAFMRIFLALSTIVFIVVFLLSGLETSGTILGYVLAIGVTSIIGFPLVRKFFKFSILNYRKNTKLLVSFGIKIAGTNVLSQLYYSIDTLMIGYFLTTRDVGYYEAATSLSRFFWFIPNVISIVVYPTVSEHWGKKDTTTISKLLEKSISYSMILLIFMGIFVVSLAERVVLLVYTQEFLPATLPLMILIIGTLASGSIRSIHGTFEGIGRPDLTLKIVAIGTLINVLLNFLFIPLYGISGASIATTLAFTTYAVLYMYNIKRINLGFNYTSLVRVTILGLLTYFILFALKSWNPYVALLISLIFGIFIVNKYFIPSEDKYFFKNLILTNFKRFLKNRLY